MKKYIFIAAAILGASGMISCTDTLTEKPDSFYEKDSYFTDAQNADMAVLGIYNSISDQNHYGSAEMATPSSDDMYMINGTNKDNTRRDISHYNVEAGNVWLQNIWILNYQGIDRANMCIDGIRGMAGYEGSEKLQQLDAEARFLRAFQAFDLVKYWGDVPFKATYSKDYSSAYTARVDRDQIFDQMVEDLNFAKEHLPWATATSSPERATQGAARAMLMRVLLQRAGHTWGMDGDRIPSAEKRKEYFEQVVKEWEAFAGSNHDFFTGGYEELFKSFNQLILNNQESLFEIAFTHEEKRSGGLWGTFNGPEVGAPVVAPTETGKVMGRANAFFRVIPEWFDFYDENDQRRDVAICRYAYKWDNTKKQHVKNDLANDKGKSKWFPGKWRREWMPIGFKDPNCTDVNYCVLRYADVVLMAAEAYNELGNTEMAWTLINKVRNRAGATEVNAANYNAIYHKAGMYNLVKLDEAGNETGQAFIADNDEQGKVRTALYWERAFELAFEGQRKYDLIRWGVLKDALVRFGTKCHFNKGKSKGYPAYINFVEGKHELFPIPLIEIQSNGLLEGKNNPGYN